MAKRTTPAKSTAPKQARADPSKQRYNFSLNPYPDSRCSTCPTCGKPTGQRKVPLFIHVDPHYPLILGYTCRYCANCNLLIAHKHEIESYLTQLFRQNAPDVIGNEYLVMGVMPREVWRAGMENLRPPQEVIDQLAKFLSYSTLQRTQTGWFPAGVEPPIEPAPPSTMWVKQGKGAVRRLR
jgi:hypothetical protein